MEAVGRAGKKEMIELCIASFFAIFLKAFQQINVVRGKYWLVPFATLGMAICEVFMVVSIVAAGASWPVVFSIFVGGTIGCWSAMYTHNRFLEKGIER